MKLSIIKAFSHDTFAIAWLEINTPKGNYVIQLGHAPTILALSPQQPITFRLKSGKEESFVARHGIVSIDRESATIIMSQQEQK